MRPTLAEQINGLHDILSRVVEPEVEDDYAHETLVAVLRALEMLAARAPEVGPFLAWDNAATLALVVQIDKHFGAAEAEMAAVVEPGDLAVLEAENERLRVRLAAAIPALSADPTAAALDALVITHLRERIARYPFASTGSLPTR